MHLLIDLTEDWPVLKEADLNLNSQLDDFVDRASKAVDLKNQLSLREPELLGFLYTQKK